MTKIILALLAAIVTAVGAWWLWRSAHAPAPDPSALYMTADDRIMNIEGATVRVRMEGPADAPAIVLIHGFIFSLETWDDWALVLKRDHRVIRFDLLGHGLSGPDPKRRYSPDERAAFVGAVMDAVGVERAVIGGNSLGGLAAWKFAAANPARVSALVLVSPGAYPANGVENEPVSPPAPMALFLKTAPDAAVAATLSNIYADPALVTPEKVRLVGAMMRREGNGEAFIQSIEEFTLPDPGPALKAITAPTLIIWGRKDKVIPVGHGERIKAAIPAARLIIYDDVGHVAQEETRQSATAVLSFLAEAGN